MALKSNDLREKFKNLSDFIDVYFILYVGFSFYYLLVVIGTSINQLRLSSLSIQLIIQTIISPYYNILFQGSFIFTISIIILMIIFRNDYYFQSKRLKIYSRRTSFLRLTFLLITIIFIFLMVISTFPTYISDTIMNYFQIVFFPLFVTTFIILTSIYSIYLLNPNMMNYFKQDERLFILSNFQEYSKLTDSNSAFLLSEISKKFSDTLSEVFSYWNYQGLDDIFVDIQLAMRIGTEEEKKSVANFFKNINVIPRQARKKGFIYSNELIKEIDKLKIELSEEDLFRERNNIKGVWRRNMLDIIKPYETAILIILTIVLIILTYFLIPKS